MDNEKELAKELDDLRKSVLEQLDECRRKANMIADTYFWYPDLVPYPEGQKERLKKIKALLDIACEL